MIYLYSDGFGIDSEKGQAQDRMPEGDEGQTGENDPPAADPCAMCAIAGPERGHGVTRKTAAVSPGSMMRPCAAYAARRAAAMALSLER